MKLNFKEIIFLVIIGFVIFIFIKPQFSASTYKTQFVYNNENLVSATSQNEDLKMVDSIDNFKIESIQTYENFIPESKVENLAKVNENMVDGFEVKIDENVMYVTSVEMFNDAMTSIVKQYLPYQLVDQLLNDRVLNDFKFKNIFYKQMVFESKIEIKEGKYEKSSVLENISDIRSRLLNNNNILKYHSVKKGETLETISKANKIDYDILLLQNDGVNANTLLSENEQIVISNPSPMFRLSTEYEQDVSRDIDFKVIRAPNKDMLLNKEKTTQKGQKGTENLKILNSTLNGEVTNQIIVANEIAVAPVNTIIDYGTKDLPDVGTGDYLWPADCRTVTVGHGGYPGHMGTDIACGYGSPIYATDNGVITHAGWKNNGGGNVIEINHNNGFGSSYNHMSAINNDLKVGDTVYKGQIVGYEGATGNSKGSHLHFEIWIESPRGSGNFPRPYPDAMPYLRG